MIFIKSILIAILFIALFWGFKFLLASIKSIESPNYQIVEKIKNIEVRQYGQLNLASVKLSGKQLPCLRLGFKKIADYIFGHNTSQERISMTTPVLEIGEDASWNITFIMPAKFSLSDLPKPLNAEVQLNKQQKGCYVVYRFSGAIKQKNINQHLKIFKQFLNENNYKVSGEPIFAFYNPPWTLPFLRRNEIWYSLQSTCIKSDKVVND